MIYEGQNAIHHVIRALHEKTGELTNQVNNLHVAVTNTNQQGIQPKGDGPTKQEVNTLISLQNQVHSVVTELK